MATILDISYIYTFVYVYISTSGPVVTYGHIFAQRRAGLLSRPGKVWYKICLGLGMEGGGSPLGREPWAGHFTFVPQFGHL